MKRITLMAITATTLFLSSCGANQQAVDNMADEMCKAMDKYNEEEPVTILAAAEDIDRISKNEADYGKITEEQLKETMEKKCPAGYAKFLKMVEDGEAVEGEPEPDVEVEEAE